MGWLCGGVAVTVAVSSWPRSGARTAPETATALDALRIIDVPGTKGYGIWAPDGAGPAASWARALLAINRETARVPGGRLAASTYPPRITVAPDER